MSEARVIRRRIHLKKQLIEITKQEIIQLEKELQRQNATDRAPQYRG